MKGKRLLGMTLLELLIAMAIMALALTSVAPGISHIFTRLHVDTVTAQITILLKQIRLVAMQQHISIWICASADGKTCQGIWHDGLLAYYKASGASSKTILLYHPLKTNRQDRLFYRGFPPKQAIQVSPLGGFTTNGSIYYCPQLESIPGKRIVLARSGRVTIQSAQC